MGNIVNKSAFLPPPAQPITDKDNIIWLTTKQLYIVPAIYIRAARQPASFTILFSHGNAEDLGCIERWLEEIAEFCNADVFGYDYPGYGLSRHSQAGKVMLMNEAGAFGAVEAAYDFLTKESGVPPNKIVAFGRSLGSGPTVHIAARNPIGGVVLQSPLLSAVRVVLNTWTTLWFDIFANVDIISKVKCPVLIIHGDRDEVINWRHGQVLHSLLKVPYPPLWIEGAGHNDIEQRFFTQYAEKLKGYFHDLETMPQPQKVEGEK